MKKLTSVALFAFSVAVILSVMSCSKSTPTVTLNGASSMSVTLNTSFTDPGSTASDEDDGDISSKVTVTGGPVNPNLKGTYTLTYSVTNKDGNSASAVRTVNVVNSVDFMAGSFNVNDTNQNSFVVPLYKATINPSTTKNNELTINNFGSLGTTVNVPFTYKSSDKSLTLIGTNPFDAGNSRKLYFPAGNVISTSPIKLKMTYVFSGDTYRAWYSK